MEDTSNPKAVAAGTLPVVPRYLGTHDVLVAPPTVMGGTDGLRATGTLAAAAAAVEKDEAGCSAAARPGTTAAAAHLSLMKTPSSDSLQTDVPPAGTAAVVHVAAGAMDAVHAVDKHPKPHETVNDVPAEPPNLTDPESERKHDRRQPSDPAVNADHTPAAAAGTKGVPHETADHGAEAQTVGEEEQRNDLSCQKNDQEERSYKDPELVHEPVPSHIQTSFENEFPVVKNLLLQQLVPE